MKSLFFFACIALLSACSFGISSPEDTRVIMTGTTGGQTPPIATWASNAPLSTENAPSNSGSAKPTPPLQPEKPTI